MLSKLIWTAALGTLETTQNATWRGNPCWILSSPTTVNVREVMSAGLRFNLIKVDNAINTAWQNAEEGFDAAMGLQAPSSRSERRRQRRSCSRYYDGTNSQMVLWLR